MNLVCFIITVGLILNTKNFYNILSNNIVVSALVRPARVGNLLGVIIASCQNL